MECVTHNGRSVNGLNQCSVREKSLDQWRSDQSKSLTFERCLYEIGVRVDGNPNSGFHHVDALCAKPNWPARVFVIRTFEMDEGIFQEVRWPENGYRHNPAYNAEPTDGAA